MLWNEQHKIYNTKIIESAKLIEQLITIFLKGIIHQKMKMWCVSAYRKGIQDVGDFFSRTQTKIFDSNHCSLSVI